MNIQLGNLRTFTELGDKEKMTELETKLTELGYSNEDNCEKSTDTSRKVWHIYDIPKQIHFSILTDEVVTLLKEYSGDFDGRVAVSASKQN